MTKAIAINDEGMEILEIDHGVEDQVVVREGNCTHIVPIHYDEEEPYFYLFRHKYYFNEFIRQLNDMFV